MQTDGFYAIVVCSNPIRYASRHRLLRDCLDHLEDLGIPVLLVELAFGGRPFAVTRPNRDMHLQLRTDQELWFKENLINLGITHLRRVRPGARYVAWIDGDIVFQRRDIMSETVEQLQHYDMVQMFSHAVDMGPRGENIRSDLGFMYQYHRNGAQPPLGAQGGWHPGYAWAATMTAIERIMLFEQAILGSGDRIMALGLIGQAELSVPQGVSPGYRAQVESWGARAEICIRRKVGYVPGLITHNWHGDKINRKYRERSDILKCTQIDPTRDLVRGPDGLLRLVDFMDERSIRMRDLIREYFRQRDEDSTHRYEDNQQNGVG
jgi:hypothetical protein